MSIAPAAASLLRFWLHSVTIAHRMQPDLLHRISTGDFLRVLRLAHETLKQRIVRNELALCFGCTLNPYRGVFLALDCYSMILCSVLQSYGLSLRLATLIVREGWTTWFPMLTVTEDTFQLDVTPPAAEQWVFGVKVAVGRNPVVVGAMGSDATIDKLNELTAKEGGDWSLPPIGASISGVLRLLRANERDTGVKLPGARLTVPNGHPDFDRFFIEASQYRQASDTYLRAKARTSKNARATRDSANGAAITIGRDETWQSMMGHVARQAVAVAAKWKPAP